MAMMFENRFAIVAEKGRCRDHTTIGIVVVRHIALLKYIEALRNKSQTDKMWSVVVGPLLLLSGSKKITVHHVSLSTHHSSRRIHMVLRTEIHSVHHAAHYWDLIRETEGLASLSAPSLENNTLRRYRVYQNLQ